MTESKKCWCGRTEVDGKCSVCDSGEPLKPVTEDRKYAYRTLLSSFINKLRTLRSAGKFPYMIERYRVEAYMLENLSIFSADDFSEFDEGWFWNDVEACLGSEGLECYRINFDRNLESYRTREKERIRTTTIYPLCQWCKTQLRKDGPCPDCGREIGG